MAYDYSAKSRGFMRKRGKAMRMVAPVSLDNETKPETCKCGGQWHPQTEKVRGAVASDGSGRLPPMYVDSWVCTGCGTTSYPGSVDT